MSVKVRGSSLQYWTYSQVTWLLVIFTVMADFRFMQWFAGQVDSDGSIGVYNKTRLPFIAIQKAEKAWQPWQTTR